MFATDAAAGTKVQKGTTFANMRQNLHGLETIIWCQQSIRTAAATACTAD